MARQDLEPDERDQETLLLPAFTECPDCELEFEVAFDAGEGVYEAQDLSEAPQAQTTCPECGASFMAVYGGWTEHDGV